MLQIRFSNRFELLEEALLDALAAPPDAPFVPEEIIVPSAAVRRRVELAAAERFGICANVRFSFLAQWLWRQIGHVVPVSEMSPFTAPVLTWRVLGIFGEPAFVAAHPPLAGYLRHADDVMRYELAARTRDAARAVPHLPPRLARGVARRQARRDRGPRRRARAPTSAGRPRCGGASPAISAPAAATRRWPSSTR